MRIRLLAVLSYFVLAFTTPGAAAEGALSVTREAELQVAPGELWGVIGGFGALHQWHPAIAALELTGDGTQPGDKRVLTLGDGAQVFETLEAYDAAGMRYSYTITESPLPVANYHSTVSVVPAAGGRSKVSWTSTFDADGASPEDAIGAVAGVYEAGLDALQSRYNSQ